MANEHVVVTCLGLQGVLAVRIARGAKTFFGIPGICHSIIIWWSPVYDSSTQIYEANSSYIDCQYVIGDDYGDVYMMNIIISADSDYEMHNAFDEHHTRTLDVDATPGILEDTATSPPTDDYDVETPAIDSDQQDRLSVIEEGSNEDAASTASFAQFMQVYPDAAPDEVTHLQEVWAAIMLEETAIEHGSAPVLADDVRDDEPAYVAFTTCGNVNIHEHAHYLAADVDPSLYGFPDEVDDNGNPVLRFTSVVTCASVYWMTLT